MEFLTAAATLPDGRAIYGFLKRDRINLHLASVSDLGSKVNTSAVYLYVDDIDTLYSEWSAVAPEGRLDKPETGSGACAR